MIPTTGCARRTRLLWLLFAIVFATTVSAFAAPGAIVISQVYGGGGNSGATLKYDFVELFNRSSAAVDVTGWSVQYGSSGGTGAWSVTPLSGTIQPGQYYLVQEAKGAGGTTDLPTPDATGNIAMSGTAGKIALVGTTAPLSGACPSGAADLVGFGSANCSETSPTPTLSNTTLARRLGGGCTDTDVNSADFEVVSALTNVPHNSATIVDTCPATMPPGIRGAASPNQDEPGQITLVTATVTPGSNPSDTNFVVTADLSAIGGQAAQVLFDDGTHGDRTAGDRVFSYAATIAGASGAKTLTVSVIDGQLRTASASVTFTITVAEPYAIHDIQGAGLASPYVSHYVVTKGIVTAVKAAGFFLQAAPDAYDADPNTSEGIYVYTGSRPSADVVLGNELEVKGNVSEYNGITEISLKRLTVLSTGNALPAAVPLTSAELNPAGTLTQLERFEGMRVHADALTASGPTDGSFNSGTGTASSYGEFYAVLSTLPRPFREPGIQTGIPVPAGIPEGAPVFDGNPEIVRVDTAALLGATPLDVTSGTQFHDVTGVLDYTYSSYAILPDAALTPVGGMTAVPMPGRNPREFTVASFNMLAFSAVDLRLSKASRAIRDVLRMPDVIGVEEVNGPAVLQAIADRIKADATANGQPDPGYAAYMPDCTSACTGFLVRSARLQNVDYNEVGADATFTDPRSGNQMIVNDRPPFVLTAKMVPEVGQPYPVTIIVSHLRSLIDVDTVSGTGDFARAKRKAGADYLAELIAQHQAAGENVITLGDYNAFEFNDGYVDVTGTVKGAPTPGTQVLLPSDDWVNPDMVDLITTRPPEERYTYVENGNAQVLDHILASQSVVANGFRFLVAHNNADFPLALHNDANRPERVSDHDMPVAYFSFPPLQADLGVTMTAAYSAVTSGGGQTYTIVATNAGPDAADTATMTFTLPAHTTFAGIAPAGWACTTPDVGGTGSVSCTTASFAAEGSVQFTVNLNVDCATQNNTVFTGAAAVNSNTLDQHAANDQASIDTTVLNPAPEIVGLAVDKALLAPPNHKLIPVTLTYELTDNCDTAMRPQIAISSDQPVNGTGDGNTASDWTVVDSHHVLLRAERAPTANGRTYTITVSVKDSAENAATSKTVEVKVPR